MKASIFYLLLVLLLTSCSQKEVAPVAVAWAYNSPLTLEELSSVIPDNSSTEDSIRIAESYISTWMREKVVLYHAEMALQEEQKDFSAQLEDYRKSLLIYAYESELVSQKLDTAVSDKLIEDYYRSNQDNYQLKDYIVQARFCILDAETPKLNKFSKLFYSEDSLDREELEEFCIENSARYYFEESQWLYLDDLLKEVPIEVFDRESFLKKNKTIEFEKDNLLYFLVLKDYKLKDSVSPLSLEKENIRSVLLNIRKNELLNKMRNDLFNDAIRKKEIRTVEIK